MVLSLDKTGCLNFNRVQKNIFLVCIYRMSTVFVVRDHAQALVDATDDAAKQAAFSNMIANASVDNGPNKISVFLKDLKAPSASVPADPSGAAPPTPSDPTAGTGTSPNPTSSRFTMKPPAPKWAIW